MDVVDGISEYLQMMPYATFLMTNGEELENLVDITLRHNISPLMVLCPVSRLRDVSSSDISGNSPSCEAQSWRVQVNIFLS